MSRALPVTAIREHSKGEGIQLGQISRYSRSRARGPCNGFDAAPEHIERSGIIDCELKAIHCRTLVDVRTTNARSLQQKKRLGEWAESSKS